MTGRIHFHFSLSCIGEGNGNPLQCSCLENPRVEGSWWAAVYGVAESRTRLKRLRSSSSRHLILLLLPTQNSSTLIKSYCFVYHCYPIFEIQFGLAFKIIIIILVICSQYLRFTSSLLIYLLLLLKFHPFFMFISS